MRKAAVGVGAGFRPVGILDRRVVLEFLLGGASPVGRVLVEGSKVEEKSQSPHVIFQLVGKLNCVLFGAG